MDKDPIVQFFILYTFDPDGCKHRPPAAKALAAVPCANYVADMSDIVLRVTEGEITVLHEDVNRVLGRMRDLEVRVEHLEVSAVSADHSP
jgi:hypothetical protein